MTIRLATPADIPAMMRLTDDSTAAHWSADHYQQVFAPRSPRRMALVIEEEEQLQGFLVAHSIADEWEIENIAIEVNARRRGRGTQLLREFLTRARAEGAAAVFLEVRVSNQAARSLYEKSSFVESGRRPHYYSQPEEDAIVYRLPLS
jgi:[ribosomal protein S18]-alanine N-acetyltransferase